MIKKERITKLANRRWRPSGWMNPYLQKDAEGDWVNSKVFEAGADAMLEALRNNQWCPFDNQLCTPLRGKVVIVPNDGEGE